MSCDPRNTRKNCLINIHGFFSESTAWRPFASCRRGWCGTLSPSSWESCGSGAAPARRHAHPARRSPLKVGEPCQARRWTVMTRSTHTCKSSIGFWRAASHPHPHMQILDWILKDSELSTPSPPTGFSLFQFCNSSFESHFPWLQSLLVSVCVY